MSRVMAPGLRSTLSRMAAGAAIIAVAVIGATVPANTMPAETGPGPLAMQDPGCDMFGWRHPMCAGGAFSSPVDDGIPGDNAAEGGIPAPAMVPNIDGSFSPPGTPGSI